MALHFELVTPARLVRSESVHMVVVPGTEGEFGVLEGHAPFMSTVRDGVIKVYRTENGAAEDIVVSGGFAEVGANGLTVLAEHVEAEPLPTRTMRRAGKRLPGPPFAPYFPCPGFAISKSSKFPLYSPPS
jgi:F-type H+-transporting ATPase subunit epsilon